MTSTDIVKVDFHCKENNRAHRTSEISTQRLIIRRGQIFHITLSSSSALKPESLEFTVQTGPKPAEDIGTKAVFDVSRKHLSKKPWDVKVKKASEKSVLLSISSPADASIGEYSLSVKTQPKMTEGHSVGSFVVLFNPWCAEDWVHLVDEKERQEYVMKESGQLYRGAWDDIAGLDWEFAQFEEDILDICLKILDLNPKCQKDAADDYSARCNPIYVGRVVSAMINCNDDRGVLQGNWSGNYWGGVSPTRWSGSEDILRQWMEHDFHPVKYGQCWVFAGVMCTVLRCLGIPCRPVTNFQSAHDTHGNLTIDYYHSERGVTPKHSEDSVWNYHVWLEGWMKRPDLSEKSDYDGWQVLDPTPQELSDGVHCCGPAAVKAIHKGHADQKYDLPFVFAEVNADKILWEVLEDRTEKKIWTEKAAVGQNISTKAVGSDERKDITDNYKYREGSDEERKAFKEALKRIGIIKEDDSATPLPPPEINIKIEESSKPINGKDIGLVIRLHSAHPTPLNLKLHITAQVMLYTGIPASDICSEKKEVKLLSDKDLTVPFQIPFSKYGSHIQGNNTINVMAVAFDKENSEKTYVAEKNIVPRNPPMSITVIGDPMQYRPVKMQIIFDNPLPVPLKDCTMTVTSSLFRRSVEGRLPFLDTGMRIRVSVPFIPNKAGQKKLVADFDCDQFRDIKASCSIDVKPYSSG